MKPLGKHQERIYKGSQKPREDERRASDSCGEAEKVEEKQDHLQQMVSIWRVSLRACPLQTHTALLLSVLSVKELQRCFCFSLNFFFFFFLSVPETPAGVLEESIDNGHKLISVLVTPSFPSVSTCCGPKKNIPRSTSRLQ